MASDNYINGVPVSAVSTTDPVGLDSDGNVQLGSGRIKPQLKSVTFNLCANGSLGTQTFFIAARAYTVVAIKYVHKTHGTVDAALTITKDTGTAAPGAGTALQTAAFDCTAANNTVQDAALVSTPATLQLAAGDRLAAKFSGTLTTLAGVVATVYLSPANMVASAPYFCKANGDLAAAQTFFIANRDMVVTAVRCTYATAFAAAVTIDVTKDTGTNAAGGGTSVLAATMAGDGTINTVLTPALAASAATLRMAAGDRLAIKLSATTTGAGVCLVVTMQPIYARTEIAWQLAPGAQQQVDQCLFIADRDYEVVDLSGVFDVTAGGASKLLVTIDKGTTAPGAGNAVHTDNTSAGFDQAATARTVQVGTLNTMRNRLLSAGDRLGLKSAGAAQNTVCNCITVALLPR